MTSICNCQNRILVILKMIKMRFVSLFLETLMDFGLFDAYVDIADNWLLVITVAHTSDFYAGGYWCSFVHD